MEKTWRPTAAGILSITAGVMDINIIPPIAREVGVGAPVSLMFMVAFPAIVCMPLMGIPALIFVARAKDEFKQKIHQLKMLK